MLAPTAHTTAAAPAVSWDEDRSQVHLAAPDRGWLWGADQRPGREPALGVYIDYGPRLQRTGHGTWCNELNRCADCEPGTVLAVLPNVPAGTVSTRYCPTVAAAKAWIESRVRGEEPIPTDDDAAGAYARLTERIMARRLAAALALARGLPGGFFAAAADCARLTNQRAELVEWGPAALAL